MYLKIKSSREKKYCHQKSYNFNSFSRYPVSYHDKSTKNMRGCVFSLHVNNSKPCKPQSFNTEHPTKCFSSNQFKNIKFYSSDIIELINGPYLHWSCHIHYQSHCKNHCQRCCQNLCQSHYHIDIDKPIVDRIDNPISEIFQKLKTLSTAS